MPLSELIEMQDGAITEQQLLGVVTRLAQENEELARRVKRLETLLVGFAGSIDVIDSRE